MVALSLASVSLLVSVSLLPYLIFSALEMLLIALYKSTFTYLLTYVVFNIGHCQ